ncbi:MAG: 4Fe-4S dicluster domain-containing protein [Candidatus Omnitrophica bacterium]|nr:4Fe-4S dicluster domain-containing protein [Candidatus Omnitrophota bacterium]
MRAIVDQDTCIGCGVCPSVCPEVFKMEGEKAVAHVDEVPEDLQDSARQAASQCPVSAIRMES